MKEKREMEKEGGKSTPEHEILAEKKAGPFVAKKRGRDLKGKKEGEAFKKMP